MTEQISHILDETSAALCRLDDAALEDLARRAEHIAALCSGASKIDVTQVRQKQDRLERLIGSTRGSLETFERMLVEGSGETWAR